MSPNSDPDQNHTSPAPQLYTDMSSLPAQLPPSHPRQVQTAFQSHTQPVTQRSPIMSPETAVLTTSSSVQPSPEPMRGRDEDLCPSSFQLHESILSRKTSTNSLGTNSLGQSLISNPDAMAEVVNKGNLIRRFSNRAHRFASRRQQSSAAPASRDGSIGPSILRRRSDSNATAPLKYSALTDADEEAEVVQDDAISLMGLDGVAQNSSTNSFAGSVNGSANAMAGPVLPAELRNGSPVFKASRKSRTKRINLLYETESNKFSWDKTRPQKSLHVDEIKEIRTGSDVQQYCLDFGVSERRTAKFLHIVTEDREGLKRWTEFLDAMLNYRQELMTSLMAFNDRAIAQHWQTEMAKEIGNQPRGPEQEELDIASVKHVCQNLHIYTSQWTLEANFFRSDARRCEKLNFTEFKDFVRRMKQTHDVQRIICSISTNPESCITFEEFLAFLRDLQGEDIESNPSLWEKHFTHFSRQYRTDDADIPDNAQYIQVMSEAAFVGFLTSEHNMPIMPEAQDYILDRPMNEYFISSSHNTYLLSRQVAGQSSVEYWDGSSGQPEVNHGRTLTTSINFREVMTTINKYAFVKSKLPLWISLEVHCNPAQQAIMVDIIKESFGSRLVTETLGDSLDKLPLPSELMERVLIKVKKPQIKEEPLGTDFRGRRRGNSLNSPLARPVMVDGSALIPSQSRPQSPMLSPSHSSRRLVSKTRINTITEGQVQELMSSSTSDNESGGERASRKASTKTVKVLGVYCAGHARVKEEKMALSIHNMRYMMRVYPDRTRITSNNFDPRIYWRHGVQMAALNWQTFDLGMQPNRAMFDGGRDCSGYVLKPTELRDVHIPPFNSEIAEGKKERSFASFTIDSMDPYVEVEVFHANDKRDKEEADSRLSPEDLPLKVQTEVIRENGFNPVFDKPLKFRVHDKAPGFDLCSVQGYRTLPLLNHAGDQYLFSKLFCKIKIDSVTKIMVDAPLRSPDGNKLNGLGGKVFSRINTSPKGTMDKSSTEKTRFGSYP
ncbi:hypothetical protein EDB81DRAFT_847111 [Dactylonectria macrodidyma]|uniref:Phosphoinositide phospholipase C n=1 Tax=Dactylonectria macrodidyma TaxID=307937 RepID=A0A9P9IM91_9HYPO|nr:hypothetical protein EDB81DRAFT_847111 [Dactylonectria macrodidyma]